jgi:predicted transcriptional regulator
MEITETEQPPGFRDTHTQVAAWVEPEIAEALDELAARSDRTRSGELRQAIRFWLKEKGAWSE